MSIEIHRYVKIKPCLCTSQARRGVGLILKTSAQRWIRIPHRHSRANALLSGMNSRTVFSRKWRDYVIPAQAEIQSFKHSRVARQDILPAMQSLYNYLIPANAGMTGVLNERSSKLRRRASFAHLRILREWHILHVLDVESALSIYPIQPCTATRSSDHKKLFRTVVRANVNPINQTVPVCWTETDII